MNDRQLIEDLLSALEYHTEQTRPIQFSRVVIEAAREYLRKPVQRQARSADTWVGLTDEERNHTRQTVTYSQLAMTAGEWAEKVQIETERRLKEKNT